MSFKRENIPNAATLINSMRSIGYDFQTAVADIIDNSITANANNISIFFPVSSYEEPYILIVDDGFGMSNQELFEAMRFGTLREERTRDDLGRFGLGLKTASISQCRKFTVISKKNDEISAFYWDIDLILKERVWNLNELSLDEIYLTPNIESYIKLKSFTIVIWENFDGFKKDVTIYKDVRDIFLEKIVLCEKHISLIFHRFLENGLKISFNGREIVKVDPFLLTHPKTTIKAEQEITQFTSEGKKEKVKIQVCVLPYYKDLTAKDYEKLGGESEIDNQGFYIYRNQRLMIFGTWFKIKPKSELSRNARIRVDIPNTLDDLWEIDVKKQKAQIPGILMEQLKKEVGAAVEKSKRIYEYKGNLEISKGSIWTKNENQRDKNIEVQYLINRESEILKKLVSKLDDENIKIVDKIFNLIELSLPYRDIYNSVSEKKEVNLLDNEKKDLVLGQAIAFVHDLAKKSNQPILEIINEVCSYEPFRSANIKTKLMESMHVK